MNFLMDLTAVDFSAFGTKPSPAFFASSGVAVSPSPEIPDPGSLARTARERPLRRRLPFLFPAAQTPAAIGGPSGGGRSGSRFADVAVGGRRLARAGSLGHVRDPLPGTSEPEAHPDVRRVRRPSASKGLPGQQAAAADRTGELMTELPAPRRARNPGHAPQRRSRASGHARDHPHHHQARWRADRGHRRRDRLPPSGLREDGGDGGLQRRHPLHRPAQLRLAAHQQHGLLHGRGEAAGDFGSGSLPLHPGHHVGDFPDHGPSHLRGRQRHGAGGLHASFST